MDLKTHIENFLVSGLNTMLILSDFKKLDLYLMNLGFEKLYSGNVFKKGEHKIFVEPKLKYGGEFFTGLELFSVVITSKIMMNISTTDLMYLRSRVRGSINEPKVFILERSFDLKNTFEVFSI